MRAAIRRDAVGVEQLGFPSSPGVVPGQRQQSRPRGRPTGRRRRGRRGRRARSSAVVADQRVRGARVAVADHEPVGGSRCRAPRAVGRTGSRRPAARRAAAADPPRSPAPPCAVGDPARVDGGAARQRPRCAASRRRRRAPAAPDVAPPPSAAARPRRPGGAPIAASHDLDVLASGRAIANVTPPNSFTHTAATGRPAAMSSTTAGSARVRWARSPRLGCLMWNRYTGQSSSSPACVAGAGAEVHRHRRGEPARTGGAVVAINHTSYFDFTFAGLPAYKQHLGRKVRFMAKKEVFDNKITGPIMRSLRHIEVDRDSGADSFDQACQQAQGRRARRRLPGGHHQPQLRDQGIQVGRGPDGDRRRRADRPAHRLGRPAHLDQGSSRRRCGGPRCRSRSRSASRSSRRCRRPS